MIVKVLPTTGTYAPASVSVAPAIVTVPVTLMLSYCVPSVAPSISMSATPARLRSPVLRMPGLNPGASVAPALTVTGPLIVPVPPSVPEATVTEPVSVPLMSNVPVPVFVTVKPPPISPWRYSVEAFDTVSALVSVSGFEMPCNAPEVLICGVAPAKVIARPEML